MVRYRAQQLAATLIVALSACEGEPPKVPVNAAPTAEQHVAVVDSTVGEAMTPAMPPAEAPKPCLPCATAAPIAAAPSAAPAAAPAPAPAAARANIVGTVTTMPAGLKSQAVVWLEDAPKDPTRGMAARINNQTMSFVPFVQVVAVGGKVTFSNGDPFPHNVFSSEPDKFNMGQIGPRQAGARVFEKPGTYALLCNLHPNMLGYLVVSPSSYFARTDAAGRFAIKDVPAGVYRATAWAPRQKPITQPVTIKDGDASVSFELHR